ncbi:MAG: hypothetical protein QM704_20905 [Anaeromyxobacteraceae bacterium]
MPPERLIGSEEALGFEAGAVRGGVVDARRSGFAGAVEHDEAREHRGDGVAVTFEATVRAAVDPVGERLRYVGAAGAALGERGRAGGDPDDAARDLGDRCNRLGLAVDGRDEQARRESGDAAAPVSRPGGDGAFLDEELVAVRADDLRGHPPGTVPSGLRSSSGVGDLLRPEPPVTVREPFAPVGLERHAVGPRDPRALGDDLHRRKASGGAPTGALLLALREPVLLLVRGAA